MKISTQNLMALPDIAQLNKTCKALSVLDAIICPDWQYRYYSYDNAWDKENQEECFHMRNGEGDEYKILFAPSGAVINGIAHESTMSRWVRVEVQPKSFSEKLNSFLGKKETILKQDIWKGVMDAVPDIFHSFVFGEPIKSLGTTFCIWRKTEDTKWSIGNIVFPNDEYKDGSEHLLYILDGNPSTYRDWAKGYYDEKFEDTDLKIDDIKHVYDFKPITPNIVAHLNNDGLDLDALKKDLDIIEYEYIGL
ncbi:MAG: hypothetical protein JWO03_318 [Bacteroidetes bacterium]|nr:hypothetical protein [Bacteroidota bacterium]